MQEAIERLRRNISEVYLGPVSAVDRVIVCLLARGHLLIEDVPGVGKTVLASAVARSLDCSFSRIQLTPDLLPADVLGASIYERETGAFRFQKGPIFANVVLADEINRASPRTQSALLEAMSEATVSMDGQVHRLGEPFVVIATQNPLEFEGTFPLPENQLDRFLMRLHLGYPSEADEGRLLDLRPATSALPDLAPVMPRDEVVVLQREVDKVRLDPSLRDYIVAIAAATREHAELRVGLSPRGSLALAQTARAAAILDGRDYCIPEDIVDNIAAVCAHRVVPHQRAAGGADAVAEIVLEAAERVPSPA